MPDKLLTHGQVADILCLSPQAVTTLVRRGIDKGNRVTFHREGPTIVLRNNCNHDMLTRNP